MAALRSLRSIHARSCAATASGNHHTSNNQIRIENPFGDDVRGLIAALHACRESFYPAERNQFLDPLKEEHRPFVRFIEK
jgi:hypothetical protein